MSDTHRLVHLAQEFDQELQRQLQRVQFATKHDLAAMEQRLTALIKGKPLDLSDLVEKGNALQVGSTALQAALDTTQPLTKEKE